MTYLDGTLSVPFKSIAGVPDLMHHKYVIRDRESVWTGSTNWTDDAWSRQEDALIVIPTADLAAAYQQDFDELWTGGIVQNRGNFDDEPASLDYHDHPFTVRGMISPARGSQISALIGQRITDARTRINICSPVITSFEILKALVTRIEGGTMPAGATIAIDGPQLYGAISQWKQNPRASWKVPIAEKVLDVHSPPFADACTTFVTAVHTRDANTPAHPS